MMLCNNRHMTDKFNHVVEKLKEADDLRTATSIVRNHANDIRTLKNNGVKLKVIHQEFFLAGAKLTFQGFKNVYYKHKNKAEKKPWKPIENQEQINEEIEPTDRNERISERRKRVSELIEKSRCNSIKDLR